MLALRPLLRPYSSGSRISWVSRFTTFPQTHREKLSWWPQRRHRRVGHCGLSSASKIRDQSCPSMRHRSRAASRRLCHEAHAGPHTAATTRTMKTGVRLDL